LRGLLNQLEKTIKIAKKLCENFREHRREANTSEQVGPILIFDFKKESEQDNFQ
jgi:hypothetical protein